MDRLFCKDMTENCDTNMLKNPRGAVRLISHFKHFRISVFCMTKKLPLPLTLYMHKKICNTLEVIETPKIQNMATLTVFIYKKGGHKMRSISSLRLICLGFFFFL